MNIHENIIIRIAEFAETWYSRIVLKRLKFPSYKLLPSHPSLTCWDGTSTFLTGFTASPFTSRLAKQPWYPNFETISVGSFPYIELFTPPRSMTNDKIMNTVSCNCINYLKRIPYERQLIYQPKNRIPSRSNLSSPPLDGLVAIWWSTTRLW